MNSLDSLSQVIHLPDSSDHTPILAFSQLRYAPSAQKGKEKEKVEWILLLGAFDDSTQLFWEKTTPAEDVLSLLEIEGAAINGDQLLKRFKESWLEGNLSVEGFNGVAEGSATTEIKLLVRITPTLTLPLTLSSSPTPSISLLSLLATSIPLANRTTLAESSSATATSRLTSLSSSHQKLSTENADLKERLKKVRSNPSASQTSPSKRSAPDGAASGRGALRAGMKGYAGDSKRLGRVVDDTGFGDDGSDSD